MENLNAIIRIRQKLKDSFQEEAKEDLSGAVMENTQSVYAGLTYGKNSLNEVLMNDHEGSRGFMA